MNKYFVRFKYHEVEFSEIINISLEDISVYNVRKELKQKSLYCDFSYLGIDILVLNKL